MFGYLRIEVCSMLNQEFEFFFEFFKSEFGEVNELAPPATEKVFYWVAEKPVNYYFGSCYKSSKYGHFCC